MPTIPTRLGVAGRIDVDEESSQPCSLPFLFAKGLRETRRNRKRDAQQTPDVPRAFSDWLTTCVGSYRLRRTLSNANRAAPPNVNEVGSGTPRKSMPSNVDADV